jgi:hypothetical protein
MSDHAGFLIPSSTDTPAGWPLRLLPPSAGAMRERCGGAGIAMVRDATAVGAVARVRPEVVLLDAQLPVVDGFAMLASGRRRWPRSGSTLADNCVPATSERNSTTRECTSPQGEQRPTDADGSALHVAREGSALSRVPGSAEHPRGAVVSPRRRVAIDERRRQCRREARHSDGVEQRRRGLCGRLAFSTAHQAPGRAMRSLRMDPSQARANTSPVGQWVRACTGTGSRRLVLATMRLGLMSATIGGCARPC